MLPIFIQKIGNEIYVEILDMHQSSSSSSQFITCQKEQFRSIIKVQYDYTTSIFKFSIFENENYEISDYKTFYLETYCLDKSYL